jgi:hypothetical protein
MLESDPRETRAPWGIPVVVGVAVGALVIWRALTGSGPEVAAPVPPASSSASAEPAPRPPAPPRCAEVSPDPFVIGDAPPRPKSAPAEATSGAPEPGEEPEDPAAPFAVEVGRGAVFDGGFAAGARRDADGSAVAMVATIGLDGKGGQLVRLGRSRGDLDPPTVAAAGPSVLAAMLEPNAGGRAIKIAKVTGTEVVWGAEFSEGRDESLAVDLAASGAGAVVVWDDVLGTTEPTRRSSVMLASFDVATMRSVSPARPVSSPKIDAGSPRIIPRPGGYWLAYVVRGEEQSKKKPARQGEDEQDDTSQGEAIATGWIEVVPLDATGAPSGSSRPVTPRKGYALSFDLELGDGGGALIAWRDDDTPTGSAGGKLSSVLVRPGGVDEARVLADETPGIGVPDLLPGWISIASVSGTTRIAALGPRGELLDDLGPEPSLGAGQPLAATKEAILWARPMGKAMRLSVVRCTKAAPGGDAGVGTGP